MPNRDHHEKPFDDGTLIKLELFEKYMESWIPVWIHRRGIFQIFDFFAGPGYGKNGAPGSPIRILTKIGNYADTMIKNGVKAVVYLNEFKHSKLTRLIDNCSEFMKKNVKTAKVVNVVYTSEDKDALFDRHQDSLRQFPSLVMLDQNGIDYISPDYLHKLSSLQRVDTLIFVPSSYFTRFGMTPEFGNRIDIDVEALREDSPSNVHRNLIDQLNNLIPANSRLTLYPFTIKKSPNIYGIVFAATHPLAVEKFLDISWKLNTLNGEANFDIDNEVGRPDTDLFGSPLSKRKLFEQQLEEFLRSEEESTNLKVYHFCLKFGHPKRHANEFLRKLKIDGKISYTGSQPTVKLVKTKSEIKQIKWTGP